MKHHDFINIKEEAYVLKRHQNVGNMNTTTNISFHNTREEKTTTIITRVSLILSVRRNALDQRSETRRATTSEQPANQRSRSETGQGVAWRGGV